MSESNQARLIVCGTHIGLDQDIPSRSLKALKEATMVVFESDRYARQFLKAAGVHREYALLSEHKESMTLSDAAEVFKKKQSIAYMSDQGMPGVEDPGQELIKCANRLGARIEVIPGPSALTAALAACPFPTTPLFFAGLPPAKTDERRAYIKNAIAPLKCAVAIFDTPYRMHALISDLSEILGNQRMGLLATSISLPNEMYQFAALGVLAKDKSKDDENFVLILAPK